MDLMEAKGKEFGMGLKNEYSRPNDIEKSESLDVDEAITFALNPLRDMERIIDVIIERTYSKCAISDLFKTYFHLLDELNEFSAVIYEACDFDDDSIDKPAPWGRKIDPEAAENSKNEEKAVWHR